MWANGDSHFFFFLVALVRVRFLFKLGFHAFAREFYLLKRLIWVFFFFILGKRLHGIVRVLHFTNLFKC